MKLKTFDVVQVFVTFSEDRNMGKSRPAIVLQVDGDLVQLVWATTQQATQSGLFPWEIAVTDTSELGLMGHTKPTRYSFRRGGIIVAKSADIAMKLGHAPNSVQSRLMRAALQA